MAFEINVLDATGIASTNVSAVTWSGKPPVYSSGGIPQYCAVVQDTGTGNVDDVKLASTGNLIYGIAQDWPAVGPGEALTVRKLGVSKAVASGAVTVGQQVYVANANGQLGPAPAAGATNSYIVGIARTPATQAGDIFSVDLLIGAATQVNA